MCQDLGWQGEVIVDKLIFPGPGSYAPPAGVMSDGNQLWWWLRQIWDACGCGSATVPQSANSRTGRFRPGRLVDCVQAQTCLFAQPWAGWAGWHLLACSAHNAHIERDGEKERENAIPPPTSFSSSSTSNPRLAERQNTRPRVVESNRPPNLIKNLTRTRPLTC